eukprot:178643_1
MSYIQHIYIITIILCIICNQPISETIICEQDENCKCSNSISDETCILDCSRQPDTCKDSSLTCRSGDPCIIKCENVATCEDGTIINAQTATDVTIICSGSDACKTDINILCGTGNCHLQCLTSTSCIDWGHIDVTYATSFTCSGGYCPTSIPQQFTISPTHIPTIYPTVAPTATPTAHTETYTPTYIPTISPTLKSTKMPTAHGETHIPTTEPSKNPTISPTPEPTGKPTEYVETVQPSQNPTFSPTTLPTVYDGIYSPTIFPTITASTNIITLESEHSTEILMTVEEQHMSHSSGNNVDIIYLIIGGLIVSLIIICVGIRMRKKRKAQYFVQDTGVGNNKSEVKRQSIVEEMHGSFGVVKCRLGTDASSIFSSHIISLKNNGLIVGSRVLKNKPQNVYDESDSDDDNNETNILPDDEKIVVYPNTVTSPSEMR